MTPKPEAIRFSSGEQALEAVGKAFIEARKHKKSQAWLDVQRVLMANLNVLISSGMFPPKDLFQICMEIDSHFVKSDAGAQEGSSLDLVTRFLNGENIHDARESSRADLKVQ